VFSLNRMAIMGTGFSFLFRGRVETAEAVDAQTVRFTLKTPFAPFLANLARLPILDSRLVMANKKDGQYGAFGDYGQEFLMAHDGGSGAYRIESHNPQELTVMAKNKTYFLGVPDAAPDIVRLRYGLDAATIRALISRGELDIASQWMAPEVKRALAKPARHAIGQRVRPRPVLHPDEHQEAAVGRCALQACSGLCVRLQRRPSAC